jgi:hypothetical protein
MNKTYICPDCRHDHQSPAHASFVLMVLCVDCETAAVLDRYAEDRSARDNLARAAA